MRQFFFFPFQLDQRQPRRSLALAARKEIGDVLLDAAPGEQAVFLKKQSRFARINAGYRAAVRFLQEIGRASCRERV